MGRGSRPGRPAPRPRRRVGARGEAMTTAWTPEEEKRSRAIANYARAEEDAQGVAFDMWDRAVATVDALRAQLAAAREELDKAVGFLEWEGYRRCDIATCNCGRWHEGAANRRL